MELAPGEDSPFHRHELDYVYVYVTPSTLAYMGEPGRVEHVRENGDGLGRSWSVVSSVPLQCQPRPPQASARCLVILVSTSKLTALPRAATVLVPCHARTAGAEFNYAR